VDVPDFKVDENPAGGMGPFIMNPEGVARFFARGGMAEGPFPEHYEPFETPLGYNPLNPNQPQATNNPAARVFPDDREQFGKAAQFPHVATTYRLTEHFHFWTKHARLNSIIQPQQFVEIGEALAKDIGVVTGGQIKVSFQPRLHPGSSHGDQAHPPLERRRQGRAHGRSADPLGVSWDLRSRDFWPIP
jgi:formate dehydrogenase major subunit